MTVREDGRCIHCGSLLRFADEIRDGKEEPLPQLTSGEAPFVQANGANLDAAWPDLTNAQLVDEPPIRYVGSLRQQYMAARNRGKLTHQEALSMVAFMAGLSPEPAWTLDEISRMVFLTKLSQDGKLPS